MPIKVDGCDLPKHQESWPAGASDVLLQTQCDRDELLHTYWCAAANTVWSRRPLHTYRCAAANTVWSRRTPTYLPMCCCRHSVIETNSYIPTDVLPQVQCDRDELLHTYRCAAANTVWSRRTPTYLPMCCRKHSVIETNSYIPTDVLPQTQCDRDELLHTYRCAAASTVWSRLTPRYLSVRELSANQAEAPSWTYRHDVGLINVNLQLPVVERAGSDHQSTSRCQFG